MVVQLSIKLGGSLVELLLPWMLSHIIDEVVPLGELSSVYLWGGMMVACAAVAWIGNVTANRMATSISMDFTRRLRHDLFHRISELTCGQMDDFTIPSLVSRMTSDTYNVHQMVDKMQRLGVRAPILLLGGLIMTFAMEPVLSLTLVGTLPLLGVVVWYVTSRSVPMYAKTQKALDTMVRKVQEMMTGVRVIKALSKVELEQKRFDEQNRELSERERAAGVLSAVTKPVMNLLLNLGLTLVIVVGAYRVDAGVTLPGKIIAFLSYFTIILNALMSVSKMFMIYSKGAASARRIAQVLESSREMPTLPRPRVETKDRVTFRNVTFSYHQNAPAVENLSFSIQKGETLGIIGATGSGKTTVLSLLLRFYDPDSGDILLDGTPVSAMEPEELYRHFGVALQNDFLMAGTVAENVGFCRPLASDELRRGLSIAQAAFVKSLDMPVSRQGANLSGGQKQRLLIARALASNPEILLLDDSSSALDYQTDAELRKALRRELADTTTLIVAQRVSSIMGAEHILVLEDGKSIGYGTHQELLNSCESYREIARIQLGEAV